MHTLWFLVVVNVIDLAITLKWRAWRQYSMYQPRTLWREMARAELEKRQTSGEGGHEGRAGELRAV